VVRLRSPNHPRPRNYLSHREQWRLLLLVMSLALVVIMIRQVRRPESVAWLGRVFSDGQASQQPAGGDAVPTPPPAMPAGPTVRITADGASDAASHYFPGVDVTPLATIRDNTYFRSDEKDAWFNLLSVLQKTPTAELQAASMGDVGYAQLIDQPYVYRGRLVTVRGTVRQVTVQHPAKNQIGLESYYRLVIRPADGGLWPMFAYVLELPAGMRPGEDPSLDVAITGFYFKNLSYQWRDGLGIAPVVLAREVTSGGAAATAVQGVTRQPIDADLWPTESTSNSDVTDSGELATSLSLAGWDRERLAAFGDDTPLTDEQRQSLIELVWRLRTFDAASLAAWTRNDISVESLLAEPEEHRGQMLGLAGHVRRVVRHALSAEDIQRLEMPAYFECELELDGDVAATVVTARVPKAWLEMSELDEPASVSGLFIKRLPPGDSDGRLLFVSKEMAWHPTAAREPFVSFGESVLGPLGMDVGLLDDIDNHRPILASEREAFYEMLQAAGGVDANQLVRLAQENLDAVRDEWAREAEQRIGEPGGLPPRPGSGTTRLAPDDTKQRQLLAEEVVRRMADGLYSVAPLFNDPDEQVGRLAVFDGMARRAVRVEVGMSPDGSPSDVLRRFGIDHYYELEVFTDDSQDYPLVFCVRELPTGFPTGGAIQEPVRVAGFFFKSWLYHTHRPDVNAAGDAAAGVPQYAPLLVSRAPVWLEPAAAGGRWLALTVAGLFVLATVCVWGLAWWWARGDRRFAQTVLSKRYAPPEGQSLNDLHIPDDTADVHD
jgi:hypothetical protein